MSRNVSYAWNVSRKSRVVKVLGPSAEKKGGVAAFTLEGVHRMTWLRFWTARAWQCAPGHHVPSGCTRGFGITAPHAPAFYLYSLQRGSGKLGSRDLSG